MSDDGEPEKRRKKKGLFGRKKKSKYDDDVADAGSFMSMEKSMVADKTMNSETKKSRGLGKRIKRIVGSGRKQRVKKNGRVDQSNVSYLGVDDDEFKNAGPRTALDPDILAAVMEDDPNDSMRSRTQSFQPKGRTASKVDDRIDEEGEFDDEDDMDMMSYGQPENNAEDAEDADMGDLNLPVSLVLLLVDPETLRFELLQLDFETPEAAKVMDVLDQIKDSVTEPVIRKQDFYAVVDRRGNQFSAATSLPKALTNRRRNRDILIGLSRGVSADKCGRLARSILGDAKVIGMLENHGYEVKGWSKQKGEESELKDTNPDTFAVAERKRQLKNATILVGAFLAVYILHQIYQFLFGSSPAALPIEDAMAENLTVEVEIETEAALEGNETMVDAVTEVS